MLHIANTSFELELAEEQIPDISVLIQSHPIFLQLQFLPLLYARPEDGMAVTHTPSPAFTTPRWHLLEETQLPYDRVESWGASRAIKVWADKRGLSYAMPPWDVVKLVNSKAFSFVQASQLPGATLVHSWEELQQWIHRTKGPRVLKSCFGLSGKGHLFLPTDPERLRKFAEKEFAVGRPLVAEPWVQRKLDFSTQWIIHPDQRVEEIGSTRLISNERGQYFANHVGDVFGDDLVHLHRHREIVFPVLQKMGALGYFGNVGIDAMVWGNDHLHPIVEINARKTMGWIALELLKHRFPKQSIALSYVTESTEDSLLPSAVLNKDGSLRSLPRKLVVSVLAN